MRKVRMALVGAAAGALLVPTGIALAASNSPSPAPGNGPAADSPAPGNGAGRGPGPRFEDCPYHEQMERQFPEMKQRHDQMRQRLHDGNGPGPMMGRGPGSPWNSPSPSN